MLSIFVSKQVAESGCSVSGEGGRWGEAEVGGEGEEGRRAVDR